MLKKLLMLCVVLSLSLGAVLASAVEVNTADETALETVKGIGPAHAKAIIDERTKNGPFKDADDLVSRVKGIGPKSVQNLEAAGLTINGSSAPPSANAGKSGSKSKSAATAATAATTTAPTTTTAATAAPAANTASEAKSTKSKHRGKKAAEAASATTATTAAANAAAPASAASDTKAAKHRKPRKSKAASAAAASGT